MISATRRAALALIAATTLGCGPALAKEAYPTKPIKIIAPFAPGGVADVMARLIGERLSKSLGRARAAMSARMWSRNRRPTATRC